MPRLISAIVVSGALTLVACGSSTSDEDNVSPTIVAPTSKPSKVVRFDCDSLGLTATFHVDHIVVELPDAVLTLPQQTSASGMRYSEGGVTFWTKGKEATLELDGATQTCRERRDQWQEAADRGVDFRGLGQEPGWFLEIDTEREIRLVYDYAEQQAVAKAPAAKLKKGAVVYDTMSEGERLRVVIEDRPCNDVMSGEAFPKAVTVTLGARTFHGCGRDLLAGAAPR